jgi:hypothetical protein
MLYRRRRADKKRAAETAAPLAGMVKLKRTD